MMTKYVLVSQGIKIYETFDRAKAEEIMNNENKKWHHYVERCMKNMESYADNEIFMYEEEVQT